MARSFWSESKAQLSIELMIILAALVALVLLLVSQIQKTGVEGAQKIESKAEDIFDKIEDIE